jgi:hypothetical protein
MMVSTVGLPNVLASRALNSGTLYPAQDDQHSPDPAHDQYLSNDLSPEQHGFARTGGIHLPGLRYLHATITQEASGGRLSHNPNDEQPARRNDYPSRHMSGKTEELRRLKASTMPRIGDGQNGNGEEQIVWLEHDSPGERDKLRQ